MPTASGHQTVADLEAAMLDRQRQQYRRLQRAALVKVYTQRNGRAPDTFADVERHFAGGFGGGRTVDPSKYLDGETITRLLTASGSTATG